MNALAEITPRIDEEFCADTMPCPGCAAQIPEPKSTSYRGLGRMEHEWQCYRCGEAFRTNARMAGMIELEPHESAAAAR